MTCFKLGDKTAHKICKEQNIPYHCFYRAMDICPNVEEAIMLAKKNHEKGRSHPRLYYKDKPVVWFFPSKTEEYKRIIKRINKNKWSIERAVERELT